MEMNSVMATEIVAAEVEHIVLPQIVSIKQASRMLGLPPYYLRRLCKEVPGVAFQSGIKWYINLGNWLIITTMRGELPQDKSTKAPQCQGCRAFRRQPTAFIKVAV